MESRCSKTVIFGLAAAGGTILLLFFFFSAFMAPRPFSGKPSEPVSPVPEFFTKTLQHGDLLFREGKTLASEVARKVSERDQRFSHVGILVKDTEKLLVIHAIHDEKKDFYGVVEEELAAFLEDGRNFGAYRMTLEESKLNEITEKARFLAKKKTPYDHDYDLSESKKLYCTEFIFHLLRNLPAASDMRTTDFLGKKVFSIENIYENEDFFEVIF